LDKATFWQLIEDAKAASGGECEAQADNLQASLSLLPAEEIISFDKIFNTCRKEAYRWDLWGAAYQINGGASDDGFEYFCRWLIGQRQAVFEAALADPDSLADLIRSDIIWGDAELDCEDLGYAASEAYQEKTGQEMLFDAADNLPNEPVGVKWAEEDLGGLFPKIAARMSSDS